MRIKIYISSDPLTYKLTAYHEILFFNSYDQHGTSVNNPTKQYHIGNLCLFLYTVITIIKHIEEKERERGEKREREREGDGGRS